MSNDNNVVNLPAPKAGAGDELAAQNRALAEAAEIARLALLPTLDYERARLKAAKEMGCRPSVLDHMIDRLRRAIWEFRQRWEQQPGYEVIEMPRTAVPFTDGSVAVGVLMAIKKDELSPILTVAADGSGRVRLGRRSP